MTVFAPARNYKDLFSKLSRVVRETRERNNGQESKKKPDTSRRHTRISIKYILITINLNDPHTHAAQGIKATNQQRAEMH